MHLFAVIVESEIVTLRRDSDASVAAARESFSISLGSLEEAVRCLDEASETPVFATIGKKPAVPKRRPLSMTGESYLLKGKTSPSACQQATLVRVLRLIDLPKCLHG